jgi:hypothetical protein
MSGNPSDAAHAKLMETLEEIKRLKGDFAFKMNFADERNGTAGNTASCNIEPTCSPSNSDACKL